MSAAESLTPEEMASLDVRVDELLAEPDEEHPDCAECGDGMATREGSDPTPLCDPCAQDALRELAHDGRRLLATVRRVEAERDNQRRQIESARVALDATALRASRAETDLVLAREEAADAARYRDAAVQQLADARAILGAGVDETLADAARRAVADLDAERAEVARLQHSLDVARMLLSPSADP